MKKLKEISVVAGTIILTVLALWMFSARGRAAQQVINVGPFLDSGLGEPEFYAFQKVNSNFTELYASLGIGLSFSNVGTNSGGFGIYRAKIGGSNVQLNMLVAGTNVIISSNASGIAISSSAGGVSVAAGNNIIATTNGNVVTLEAEDSGNSVTNASNLGSGYPVFGAKTGQSLSFRSLTNSGIITLTTNANGEITIGGTTSNLMGHINVANYNSIENGTGDNSVAFTAALNAAAAAVTAGAPGKSVYVPSGRYRFTNQTTWLNTWTNVGIIGDGRGRSVLIFEFGGAPELSSGTLLFSSGLGRYKITAADYAGALVGNTQDARTWGSPNNTVGTTFVFGGAATNTIVSSGGSGYSSATVEFAEPSTPGNTRRATGTVTVGGGQVLSVTIIDPGTGYVIGQPLTMTFSGPGTGAAGTFAISDASSGAPGFLSATRKVLDLDADVGSGIRIDPPRNTVGATWRNLTFQGLTFAGANLGNSGSPYELVYLGNNFEDVLFDECEFATARHAGLRVSSYTISNDIIGKRLTVRNCHFRDIITPVSDTSHGAALLTAGGIDFRFVGLTFTNIGGGGQQDIFAHGIYSQQHTNLTVSDSHFFGTNSRLHIISMENKDINVFDNFFYDQQLNYVAGRNVRYDGNWHSETTIRFASLADIEIGNNYFESSTNLPFIENNFTESARANIHNNRFVNLQPYAGAAGLNTTRPAISSVTPTDNWWIHKNFAYNQQLVRLYGTQTNTIIEGNKILSVSNNFSDGYIFLDYGGTVKNNDFTFLVPVSTARAIEIPSAGMVATVAYGNTPTNINTVGTTNKTYVLYDPADDSATVNGTLKLNSAASQFAIMLPDAHAIRSGTAGGTTYFDLGTAHFRDGNGSTAGGHIRVEQNAHVLNKLYVTNAVNGGYTRIESNSITVSGGTAGSLTLYDDTGTKWVRQQSPSTVTSNLNVIWPAYPSNGVLTATASSLTNITLTYGAAGGGTPGGSDTHVAFNDVGVFGGDAGMTFIKATDRFSVLGDSAFGVAAAANTRLTIKGATADSSAYILQLQDSAAYPRLTLRNDGVLTINADIFLGAGFGLASQSTGAEVRFPAGGNVDITPITPGIAKFNRAMTTVPFTLTDGANIATDAGRANHFRVTLGGNRTLDNPTALADGAVYIWEFIQDGTGSRTITLGSVFALGTDISSVTLTTTINKRDFMTCVYNSTATKLYVIDFKKGY